VRACERDPALDQQRAKSVVGTVSDDTLWLDRSVVNLFQDRSCFAASLCGGGLLLLGHLPEALNELFVGVL
jgi:hypothetical protein